MHHTQICIHMRHFHNVARGSKLMGPMGILGWTWNIVYELARELQHTSVRSCDSITHVPQVLTAIVICKDCVGVPKGLKLGSSCDVGLQYNVCCTSIICTFLLVGYSDSCSTDTLLRSTRFRTLWQLAQKPSDAEQECQICSAC